MAGHVRKAKDGRARPWLATYHDDQGRRRTRSFTRKLDADRFLADQTVKVLDGRWVDPSAGRVTFGVYAAEWVRDRPIRDSTRTRYEGYLGHMRELRDVPLANLRASTLRTWQAALSARVAKSTARTIRGVASSILRSAVTDRLIAASPLDGVPLPPKPDRVLVRPYSAARVQALRDCITPRYSAGIVVGAGLGLRRGEAMGLTVDRVDFLRREVTVDRQLIGVRAGRPVFGPPKTAASVRIVPAPQSVLDVLAAHLATYGPGPDGLLFTAPRGGPVTRAKVGEAWRDAEVRLWAREQGLDLGPDGWRIPAYVDARWLEAHPDGHGHRFHELRHFYASTLIAAGESVKVVQARLGHANAAETLDTYAHLWPDDDERTRSAIDDVFAPKPEGARAIRSV
jgi:integrase